MKRKNLDPNSPEVTAAAIEMLRRMTPEEALAFITYRTPGIEETDMTGMLSKINEPNKQAQVKNHTAVD